MTALTPASMRSWIQIMRQCAGLPAEAPMHTESPHILLVNRAYKSGRSIVTLPQVCAHERELLIYVPCACKPAAEVTVHAFAALCIVSKPCPLSLYFSWCQGLLQTEMVRYILISQFQAETCKACRVQSSQPLHDLLICCLAPAVCKCYMLSCCCHRWPHTWSSIRHPMQPAPCSTWKACTGRRLPRSLRQQTSWLCLMVHRCAMWSSCRSSPRLCTCQMPCHKQPAPPP